MGGGSPRYEELKLREKIWSYLEGSDSARLDLSDLTINDENIIGVLDEIKGVYDELEEKATRIIKTSRQQTQELRKDYVPIKKYNLSELRGRLEEYFCNYERAPNNFPRELDNTNVNAKDFLEFIVNILREENVKYIGNVLKKEKRRKDNR